jgi:integrase/recombinase XerD
LGREKFFWEIPRPKKPFQLPPVFNERELQRMFAAVMTFKHKALSFTVYSAGLRVSEVTARFCVSGDDWPSPSFCTAIS